MIDILQRIDLLSKLRLFNNMNKEHLTGVALYLEERSVPAKNVIYEVGDRADGFYIIFKGEVFASRFPTVKGDQTSKLLVKGDYFGEEVAEERNRLATFIAVENSILLFLSRKNFEKLLVQYPEVKDRLSTFKSPFYKQLLQYFAAEKDFILNERISSNEISKSNRPLRVFLCHSSADKRAVRDLHKKLVDREIDVWFDEKKLLGGQKWKMEIPKAVRNSDVVIICLSKTSITKEGYVQAEIKFALDVALEKPEGTIFLIPTRLEECEVPNNLREWHWVNLFDPQGFDTLIKSLETRASSLGLKIKDIEKIESELIEKAVEILRDNQRASVSMLQRRLKIKYTNSIHLLDQLEAMGVVGPAEGITQSREVLIGKDIFVEEDEL